MANSAGKKQAPITSFFGPPKPASPELHHGSLSPSTTEALRLSQVLIIDVDAEFADSESTAIPNGHPLLSRLRALTSSLPLSVPIGLSTDVLACFAQDPRVLLLPGQDAWEELIDPTYNRAIGFGKSTAEIQGLIRRGKFGMDGFCDWTTVCFELLLDKAPALLELRLEKIIQAMINLYVINSPIVQRLKCN